MEKRELYIYMRNYGDFLHFVGCAASKSLLLLKYTPRGRKTCQEPATAFQSVLTSRPESSNPANDNTIVVDRPWNHSELIVTGAACRIHEDNVPFIVNADTGHSSDVLGNQADRSDGIRRVAMYRHRSPTPVQNTVTPPRSE